MDITTADLNLLTDEEFAQLLAGFEEVEPWDGSSDWEAIGQEWSG